MFHELIQVQLTDFSFADTRYSNLILKANKIDFAVLHTLKRYETIAFLNVDPPTVSISSHGLHLASLNF
jgi:hypothetical protein